MTDDKLELSRRKILASAGVIGLAGAGAGLGTSAYFSDQETFTNNQLTAGELDMKVAATNYYSDWMDGEDEHISMADPSNADFVLPAPPGLEGAKDIAFDLDEGEGQAFLNDTATNRVNGGLYGVGTPSHGRQLCDTDLDADEQMLVELTDVKPGDFGIIGFHIDLCDNPGYVWLTGDDVARDENGVTEPEGEDPQEESGRVELLDQIQVAVFRDLFNAQDLQSGQFSLRTFLELVNNDPGFPLIGDSDAEDGGGTGRSCFAAAPDDEQNEQDIFVVWWLPIDHGNEVQTDSVTFDLGFYTEQCRHNDGTGPTRSFDSAAVGGIDIQDQPLGDPIAPPGTLGRVRLENVRYTGSTDTLANAPPPIKANANLIANLNDNVPAVDESKDYFVVGLHTPGVGSSIPTRRDSLIGVAALPTGEYPGGIVMPVAPTPFTGSGFPSALTGQKPVAATLWHGPVAPSNSGITGPITNGDNDPYIDAAVVRFPIVLSTGTATWTYEDTEGNTGIATTAGSNPGAWTTSSCADWIDPDNNSGRDDAPGEYTFETSFDVPPGGGTLEIREYAADNDIELAVDGQTIASTSNSSFGSLSGPVSTQLSGGSYTLTATVENYDNGGDNPVGVLVCGEVVY